MIKVFIIDDSLTVRNSLVKLLKGQEEIKVIGEAPNPVDAIPIFKKVGFPDLFILDIEMPKMDGLTFLKKINEQNPTPVIICSTLVSLGSNAAIDALRYGAVELILKPQVGLKEFFEEQRESLILSIKSAARSKIYVKQTLPQPKQIIKSDNHKASKSFIAIGSSTGGVQILEDIITNLEPNHKGIVIVQHMPQGFTKSFAHRLDSICNSKVVEACDDEIIQTNKIIIAQGGIHMEVVEQNGTFVTKLKDLPKVNSHKPSVNLLFKSLSKINNLDAIAFILTGMGDDGAKGMKKLHDLGIKTYGQNEKSCIIYGMPKEAKKLGGIDEELSTEQIIETINNFSKKV